MNLTLETYHSRDANKSFFSASQIRNLAKCPARTLALLNGTFAEPEDQEWKLIGEYVDKSLLTPSRLDTWKAAHKEDIASAKTGKPYAWVARADAMVARCQRDALFMKTIRAEPQCIIEWEMFGHPFKAALDICDAENDYIADLKTCADFADEYDAVVKGKLPWYDVYYLQLAIYREAYKHKIGHHPAAEFLCAVTKHKSGTLPFYTPDLQIVAFFEDHVVRFESELIEVELHISEWARMKSGEIEPRRCESPDCNYCRFTRGLKETAIIAAGNWKADIRMSKEF